MGVGILSDCVFFLKVNSLPFKQKLKLKNDITSNGGAVSLILNEKCTHVVVLNTATLNSTQQKRIQKHCIPIVNPDFIWKWIQEEKLPEFGWHDDNEQLEEILVKVKDDKKSRFLSKFMNENKENLTKSYDEEFEDDGEAGFLPEDTEVAKYCFLKKDDEVAIVELLCFNEQSAFPFKIYTTRGIPGTSQKELTFHQVETAESACEKYELRIKDLRKKGFVQVDKIPPQAESFVSQSLQKVLIGEAISVSKLSPEVAAFVESIWIDALGHLDSILSCPVENISLNDVSKAEGILHQVRNALTKGDRTGDICQMMLEFYQFLPHKEKRLNNVDRKFLTVKQDLCQLIRDMVNVCETSLPKSTINTASKYQALRCRVEKVDANTEEFERVQQEILDNNHSNIDFKVLHVFRIGRLSEAANFKSDLGNVKSLLHASAPCNFVGILSRGLLLPKMIVEEFGLERTDLGNLGSGIYFSDSISTSVKYAACSAVNGVRLLMLCDVALGKTTPFYSRDYTLTEPPTGFHSVLGVRSQDSKKSDFTDNEYVVYNVDQVKMRYVVQFCTTNDVVGSLMDICAHPEQTPEDNRSPSESSDDVSLEELPETETSKAALLGNDGQPIPLQSIHIKARLLDLAAQVVIFQTYKNNSDVPIEAKYVFPLDSTAAVCGFEAFINGKHIIGEVKEKQKAHREYRAAISEGHGAYLMDQDAPDVFTVSVGNLPAKATVVIKISYVSELNCQYSSITFSIPGTVASWQQDKALKENTQDVVTKVGIESDEATKGSFCLDMSIEMPRKIESIFSYTHTIKTKKTDCKAVIQTVEDSTLSEAGFSICLSLEDSDIPRMWIEKHPDLDSVACMLIFQPQFEDTYQDAKITICLDCSNSMQSCFHSAKLIALLALSTLSNSNINLVLFGSTYKELSFYPKYHEDKEEMIKFIKMAKPDMGSTEFWKPLQSLCLLRPSSGHQKVLLISDGHLQNENLVFQILKKNKEHINVFTCGVGSTANKHMLRSLAQRGTGAFEFFADKSKSSWKDQMENQQSKLTSPACTAVSVKWRQFDRNPPKPVQAPASIQAVFPNDNLFVYGFVRHCTQATLKALLNNEELENMVSTTELQKTTGTILHKLTARALIKDYEDGILHEQEHEDEAKKQEMKSFIIDISMQHSIITQFTSFVAVEKRNAEEDMNIEPDVIKIISDEDVDILPYIGWTDDKDDEDDDKDDHEDDDGESVCEVHDSNFFTAEENGSPLVGSCRFVCDAMEISHEIYNSCESENSDMSNHFSLLYEEDSSDHLIEPVSPMDMQEICSPAVYSPTLRTSAFSADGKFAPASTAPIAYCPTSPSATYSSSAFGSSAVMAKEKFSSPPVGLSWFSAKAPTFAFGSQTSSVIGSSAALPPALGASGGSGLAEALQAASCLSVPANASVSEPPYSSIAFGSPAVQERPGSSAQIGSTALVGQTFAFGSQISSTSDSPAVVLSAKKAAFFDSPGLFAPPPPLPPQGGLFGSAVEPQIPDAQRTFDSPALKAYKSSAFFGSTGLLAPSNSLFGSTVQSQAQGVMSTSDFPVSQASALGTLDSAIFLSTGQFAPPPPVKLFESAVESQISRVPSSIGPPALFPPALRASVGPGLAAAAKVAPPPAPDAISVRSARVLTAPYLMARFPVFRKKCKRSETFSWPSIYELQSKDGYWPLTPELGRLLNIDVCYLSAEFLVKKGICSLGSRGIDEIHKLIATLLVLQLILIKNLLSEIKFKSLMKLDESFTSSPVYPDIKRAVDWAVKTDRQYPGICNRLGLGKDWDHATRQLLGIEPVSSTSDLYPALEL